MSSAPYLEPRSREPPYCGCFVTLSRGFVLEMWKNQTVRELAKLIFSLGLLLNLSPALAQGSPTSSEAMGAEGAELFELGVEAMRRADWETAHEAFARSYQLSPRGSTLLNLATAQAEVGLLVESVESYRRFVREATSGRAVRFRRRAQRALDTLEARIAHLTLDLRGLEPSDVVELDGRPLDADAIATSIPVNPGSRVVAVSRDGSVLDRVTRNLAEGEQAQVVMVLPAPILTEPPPVAADDDLVASPWLWGGVAGAVVAVGLAIGLGVGLSEGGSPYTGNFGPGRLAFE